MVRLGDVCEISSSKANLTDDKIWLLNLDMVEQQTGKIISYYYVNKNELNGSITQFDTENILYSKLRPNLNKVVVPDRNGFSTSELLPLKPNSKILCREYLALYLRSDSFVSWAISKTAGAKMPRLGTKALLDKEIPLPPLDEQRRIAATLDKVTDLISKRRQQLDKLDELVKARFVEMFGDLADPKCQYARCKLVGACVDPDDIKCGPFGTQLSKDEYQESGVAVWEIPQINSGFKEYPTHFLTAEKARQLSAYSLIPGDIAMSRKGNVGRCGLYPKTFKPGIIHSDVLRIRVDSNRVDPCFMMYQLHFSRAVERQIEMVSSGAIMAGINVTKLKHIYVHIPPVNLQRQFTYFVDQTENIKTTISRSLEKLETLKKALMQEYFGS